MAESRHLSQTIARSAAAVYEYASDPANLPEWASGLGSSVEHVDGQWLVDSPDGRLTVVFAERNDYGILDHDVTLRRARRCTTRCGSSPTATAALLERT